MRQFKNSTFFLHRRFLPAGIFWGAMCMLLFVCPAVASEFPGDNDSAEGENGTQNHATPLKKVENRLSDPLTKEAGAAKIAQQPLQSSLAPVSVHIEAQTVCLNEPQVRQALTSVLGKYPEKRALMSIVASDAPTETGTNVHLRVIMNSSGEITLDRHFNLTAVDCGSAAELLSIVLEQFLTDFSVEAWQAENRAQPVSAKAPAPGEQLARTEPAKEKSEQTHTARLAGLLFVSANARWMTPGADFEVGLALDTGTSAHRLIAGAIYRGTVPLSLGEGRYMENLFLLGVGWQYMATKVVTRIEVRVGADLVSGMGYATNYNRWNFHLELNGALLLRLGTFLFGPQLGASPLKRHVYMAEGPKEDLSNFRAGLILGKTF